MSSAYIAASRDVASPVGVTSANFVFMPRWSVDVALVDLVYLVLVCWLFIKFGVRSSVLRVCVCPVD